MNHKSLPESLSAGHDRAAALLVAAGAYLAATVTIVVLVIHRVPLWLPASVIAGFLAGFLVIFAKRASLFSNAETLADLVSPPEPADGKFIVPIEPPAPPRNFQGREAELALIHQRFTSDPPEGAPVAVITGVPGIGKTALAAQYASHNLHTFPDGQLYVELKQHPAGRGSPVYDVLADFLLALQTAGDGIPWEEDRRLRRYRKLAAERRLLVIIDNACHTDCVIDLLPPGQQSAAIVISRSPLAGLTDALHIELPPLSQGEGIRLLESSVGTGVVESNPVAADQLAGTGHPLAIRLAATALTRQPHWSQKRGLEKAQKPADGEAAVEANLALIARLLAPEERKALRCLALLDEPEFAAWELAALLERTEADAVKLADNLASVDLVHRTSGGQAGIVKFAVDEHVLPYLLEPDKAAERRKNLARVRAARRQQRRTHIEVQLSSTIWEWRDAGRLIEASEAARGAVAYAHENRYSDLEALALATLADLRLEIGNISGAHDLARTAETLAAPVPARALRCLGSIMARQDHPGAAQNYLSRALKEAVRTGDGAEEIRALMEQAIVLAAMGGQHDQSMAAADQAIGLCREREELAAALPNALYARSKALLASGDLVQARGGLDEAIEVASTGQTLVLGWIGHLYAQVMLELKASDAAIRWSTEAIDRFGAVSHRYGVACARLTLGTAYSTCHRDRLDEAVATVSDALETLQNCDDPLTETRAKRILADLLVRRGRAQDSPSDIDEARRIFEDMGEEVRSDELRTEFEPDPPELLKRSSRLLAVSRRRSA